MKNTKLRNLLLMMMAVLMCASSLAGCRNQEVTETTAPPEPEATFLQLLGFESYEEVVGAKIELGNNFGSMGINTDEKYITQGEGSLALSVQGDYANQKAHPYFKLDFLNTTCATCDFSRFKNISFDVYNATDKELHIQAGITVGKTDGNYIAAAKETYTLAPNSWTTCTYDFMKMAGSSIYDFTSVRYLTIGFLEHKQSREDLPTVFYFDNLIGNYFADGEKPEQMSFDFHDGLDFETSGQELVITGQGKPDNDAVIDLVKYADLKIPALENGGEYALKLSHDTFRWPTLRMNFGEELAAGTKITFMAYAQLEGENLYNKSIFEFSASTGGSLGDATTEFPCDAWVPVDFTLKTAATYVDLFWNYDRAVFTGSEAYGEVYIDNIIAIAPVPPIEPEGDIHEGWDFEIEGNIAYFEGFKIEGAERNDATIERVSYADVNIPALSGGGEYALKLSHETNYWPTFRINFGKTLPKGARIRFMAYAQITSGTSKMNKSIFEFSVANGQFGGEATPEFPCDTWEELTITLPQAVDHIDLFWNYDRAQITSQTAAAEVYIDNMIALAPEPVIEPVGDWYEGLDFETLGNVGYFVGVGETLDQKKNDAKIERVSYANLSIPAPENGGEYAMKLSNDAFPWPNFRINLGKTMPAGTMLTFDVYTWFEGWDSYEDVKAVVLQPNGETKENHAVATDQYNQIAWIACGSWQTKAITLTEDCDHLILFYNIGQANGDKNGKSAVYFDNFKAIAPAPVVEPVGDWYEGIGFEVENNDAFFTGVKKPGAEMSDASIERISYADAKVSAPANGGEYALKLSHGSFCWPTFRINFGKVMPAGTQISFYAYGDYDHEVAEGENKYIKVELTAESKEYAESTDPNQVIWTLVNQWKASDVITLTKDSDHLDLCYNVADGQQGEHPSWILLDNIKAVDPDNVPEPTEPEYGDITNGYDFEEEVQAQAITGAGKPQDVIIDRVSYADINVTAPASCGEYALKLSHGSFCWPTFRINFGKVMPAGTQISFYAYGDYDHEVAEDEYKYIKLELTAESKEYAEGTDPNQVIWTLVNQWKASDVITLTKDSDHLDLCYNVADGQQGEHPSWILLDNIKAVDPTDEPETTEPSEDEVLITDGYDFEEEVQAQAITGTGAPQDAIIERVSYADINVTAPASCGEYAMKLSHIGFSWPTFRINFGKVMPAGTQISFYAYGDYDHEVAEDEYKYIKVELTAESKEYAESTDPNQVIWTLVNQWKASDVITLTKDSDHLDLCYNVADGQQGEHPSWILLDNIKAVVPGEPETTEPSEDEILITDGIDFENADHAQLITGAGAPQDAAIERVSYADAGVTGPANGGSYSIKLSHNSHGYPTFRVNFGKKLPAGTEITFDAYGDYEFEVAAGSNKYLKIELTADSKSKAESSDPNQVIWMLVESWTASNTITLKADCSYLDFFYNVAEVAGEGNEIVSYVLLDNIKAVVPAEPETTEPEVTEPDEGTVTITDGIDFENANQAQTITGTGADQDATIQRVSYADAGVSALANGGSYAMKVSHSDHYWPTFRVNFGETLPAGTVITFDAYGNYDYAAAAGEYKYVKIELSADSKNYAETIDPNQLLWTLVETWNTGCTITLTAESDHVDLFYNVADGQHTAGASYLLLDNFLAVKPSEPETTEPETTEPETTEPETTEPETTEPETTQPEAEETVVTITFDDTSKRTVLTTEQQVWVENGITVINDKAGSTSNVADYSNPVRFYKNSTVTVECAGMTKIVWDASGTLQAGYLQKSIKAAGDSNVTVTVSGKIVTIEFAEPVNTFLVTCSGGQCRATSMEIHK